MESTRSTHSYGKYMRSLSFGLQVALVGQGLRGGDQGPKGLNGGKWENGGAELVLSPRALSSTPKPCRVPKECWMEPGEEVGGHGLLRSVLFQRSMHSPA
jgi:hypothetical protein